MKQDLIEKEDSALEMGALNDSNNPVGTCFR